MMENKINIEELLKDCPKGTKLYSPLFGEVEFDCIEDGIGIKVNVSNGCAEIFYSNGRYYNVFTDAECLLFPSKDQRDWSKFEVAKPKFDISSLKPFDSRVLVRNADEDLWKPAVFGCYIDKDAPYYVLGGICWRYCIPYEENEELLGTTQDCDEYFKIWEK